MAQDTANDPGAAPGPKDRWRRWSRRRRVLTLVAAVGAAGAVAAGTVAAVHYAGTEESGGVAASAKLTPAGEVACAKVIAEGTVARTETQGDRSRVVLDVARYLKPERGPEETTFTVPRAEAGYFPEGERMLISVSRFPKEPVQSFTGAEATLAWDRLAADLPASRDMTCDHPG
ncbi:hypothetical protein ABT354_21600 [Streptomyces sp. NPDC000594]|uniref:hypothetical protein n=1 Tax=Streptomyces sp. NPDC000594 TaxID=3154261 RepID=UPI00331E6D9C